MVTSLFLYECGSGKLPKRRLLNFLFEHTKSPEFFVRFNWNVNDVAFWDNRAACHYAVADYTSRRVMKRVALVGHKPVRPNG